MKKQSKKDERNREENEMRDYNTFLQDIEEDPEMRANINLYKDEDVINSLTKQLSGLTVAPKAPEAVGKSPADAALDAGQAVVGGQARKVVKAKRSTTEGQAEKRRAEALRKKDADLFKASITKKKALAAAGDEDDSDWEEDVEEDFPHVKLAELLDGLTLEVGGGADDDDEDLEEDDAEDGAAAGESV